MADTPGWYDNAERVALALIKSVTGIITRLMKSPLAYILTFAALSVAGHVWGIPILEEIVPALVDLKDLIVPGASS